MYKDRMVSGDSWVKSKEDSITIRIIEDVRANLQKNTINYSTSLGML